MTMVFHLPFFVQRQSVAELQAQQRQSAATHAQEVGGPVYRPANPPDFMAALPVQISGHAALILWWYS
jgi:hypothetical protein